MIFNDYYLPFLFALVGYLQAYIKAYEVSELEERITALENGNAQK